MGNGPSGQKDLDTTGVLEDACPNGIAEGEAQRTTFLVKDLLYVPRTVYRILSKTLSPIKGHNSNTEEVVGIMKNLLFHI